VAALALATTAFAGDYHSGITLKCFDCHVMHYSQQHGYSPGAGTGGTFTPLGPGGPFHYLLRDHINELCLACHDGQSFAPDVFEAHGNGYVRQAGALNEVGGNSLYPENTGHSLNSTAVAPGSNPAWSNPDGLHCVNCHAAHGGGYGAGHSGPSGSYRNIGGYGTAIGSGVGITYARGDQDGPNTGVNLTYAVFEDNSAGTNGNHYGYDHVTFNEPDPTGSMYADACKACHTEFHGAVGGTEIGGSGTPPAHFDRHPNGGVEIGAIGGGHSNLTRFVAEGASQLQVMSPAGVRHGSYTTADTDLTPSCMTCHKAHGNQNAFGLIYVLGANAGGGAMTEEGDGGTDVRNTCRACHVQGGAETEPW
jgi:hypothetical protein